MSSGEIKPSLALTQFNALYDQYHLLEQKANKDQKSAKEISIDFFLQKIPTKAKDQPQFSVGVCEEKNVLRKLFSFKREYKFEKNVAQVRGLFDAIYKNIDKLGLNADDLKKIEEFEAVFNSYISKKCRKETASKTEQYRSKHKWFDTLKEKEVKNLQELTKNTLSKPQVDAIKKNYVELLEKKITAISKETDPNRFIHEKNRIKSLLNQVANDTNTEVIENMIVSLTKTIKNLEPSITNKPFKDQLKSLSDNLQNYRNFTKDDLAKDPKALFTEKLRSLNTLQATILEIPAQDTQRTQDLRHTLIMRSYALENTVRAEAKNISFTFSTELSQKCHQFRDQIERDTNQEQLIKTFETEMRAIIEFFKHPKALALNEKLVKLDSKIRLCSPREELKPQLEKLQADLNTCKFSLSTLEKLQTSEQIENYITDSSEKLLQIEKNFSLLSEKDKVLHQQIETNNKLKEVLSKNESIFKNESHPSLSKLETDLKLALVNSEKVLKDMSKVELLDLGSLFQEEKAIINSYFERKSSINTLKALTIEAEKVLQDQTLPSFTQVQNSLRSAIKTSESILNNSTTTKLDDVKPLLSEIKQMISHYNVNKNIVSTLQKWQSEVQELSKNTSIPAEKEVLLQTQKSLELLTNSAGIPENLVSDLLNIANLIENLKTVDPEKANSVRNYAIRTISQYEEKNNPHSGRKVHERLGQLIYVLDQNPDAIKMLDPKNLKISSRIIKNTCLQFLRSSVLENNELLKRTASMSFLNNERIQDILTSNSIAMNLITSDGYCNTGMISLIKKTFLNEKSLRDTAFQQRVIQVLDELQTSKDLQNTLNSINPPSPSNTIGKSAIQAQFGLSKDIPYTVSQTRSAALSSLMTSWYQGKIGSCYVTSVILHIAANDLNLQLQDLKSLLEEGKLKRRVEDREKTFTPLAQSILNTSKDEVLINSQNMIKDPLKDDITYCDIASVPFIQNACLAIGIKEKEISKTLHEAILVKKGEAPKTISIEKLIQAVVQNKIGSMKKELLESTQNIAIENDTSLETFVQNAAKAFNISESETKERITDLRELCLVEKKTATRETLIEDLASSLYKTKFLEAQFALESYSQAPLLRLWENTVATMDPLNKSRNQQRLLLSLDESLKKAVAEVPGIDEAEKDRLSSQLFTLLENYVKKELDYIFSPSITLSGNKDDIEAQLCQVSPDGILKPITNPHEFRSILIKGLNLALQRSQDESLRKILPQLIEKEKAPDDTSKTLTNQIIKSVAVDSQEKDYFQSESAWKELKNVPWRLVGRGGNELVIAREYLNLPLPTTPSVELPKTAGPEQFEKLIQTVRDHHPPESTWSKEARILVSAITPDYGHAFNLLANHSTFEPFVTSTQPAKVLTEEYIKKASKFYTSTEVTPECLSTLQFYVSFHLDVDVVPKTAEMIQLTPELKKCLGIENPETVTLSRDGFLELMKKKIDETKGEKLHEVILNLFQCVDSILKHFEPDPKSGKMAQAFDRKILQVLSQPQFAKSFKGFHDHFIYVADLNYGSLSESKNRIAYYVNPRTLQLSTLATNEKLNNFDLDSQQSAFRFVDMPKEYFNKFDITEKELVKQETKFQKKLQELEKSYLNDIQILKETAQRTVAFDEVAQLFEEALICEPAVSLKTLANRGLKTVKEEIRTELQRADEVYKKRLNTISKRLEELQLISPEVTLSKIEQQTKEIEAALAQKISELEKYPTLQSRVPLTQIHDDLQRLMHLYKDSPHPEFLHVAQALIERAKVELQLLDQQVVLLDIHDEYQKTLSQIPEKGSDCTLVITRYKYIEGEEHTNLASPQEKFLNNLKVAKTLKEKTHLVRTYTHTLSRRIEAMKAITDSLKAKRLDVSSFVKEIETFSTETALLKKDAKELASPLFHWRKLNSESIKLLIELRHINWELPNPPTEDETY